MARWGSTRERGVFFSFAPDADEHRAVERHGGVGDGGWGRGGGSWRRGQSLHATPHSGGLDTDAGMLAGGRHGRSLARSLAVGPSDAELDFTF